MYIQCKNTPQEPQGNAIVKTNHKLSALFFENQIDLSVMYSLFWELLTWNMYSILIHVNSLMFFFKFSLLFFLKTNLFFALFNILLNNHSFNCSEFRNTNEFSFVKVLYVFKKKLEFCIYL